MISSALVLLRTTPHRREFLLFVLLGLTAVVIGFIAVPPAKAEWLIVQGGYYFIFALFCAFLFFAWRVRRERVGTWRLNGWILSGLGIATAMAVWTDSFAHKVLFDEYVLQATAWHMHATKEIGTPLRAYDIAGTWLTIDTFLDKRPYFFSFLLSLTHDFTGFRIVNAFVLNVALAYLTLGLLFGLVRDLTGRIGPAFLAVALMATLPLFGQNATGAGMDLHNLCMIALVMAVAVLYLRAPGANRLSLLVLTMALLAESRYESVIFVFPVAVIVLLGWLRANEIILPWTAILSPLLFVPYAWHSRFVAVRPALWQLREGESSRFGWEHVRGNLEGARNFFFSTSPSQPNSLWLTLLGLAGLCWIMFRAWERLRAPAASRAPLPPVFIVGAWCSLAILANIAVLLFYYWSRFDEPVAARFSLPLYLLLTIVSGGFIHALDLRGWHGTRIAAFGLAAWVLAFGVPAYARRLYSTQNLVMHELDWELERVKALRNQHTILLITNKALVAFLLDRIPATTISRAGQRADEIQWHMQQGTFDDVLVSQVVRPTSENGDPVVDPDDALPDRFHLTTLDMKRFGGRWIRISRLTGIETAESDSVPDVGDSKSAALQ